MFTSIVLFSHILCKVHQHPAFIYQATIHQYSHLIDVDKISIQCTSTNMCILPSVSFCIYKRMLCLKVLYYYLTLHH